MGTSAHDSRAGWVTFADGLLSAGTADRLAAAGPNDGLH
jgi:hypothetical protein